MGVSYLLVVWVGGSLEVTIAGRSYVLEKGYYVYVGSARLARPYLRILRHFSPSKRLRWHIDYLTSHESVRPVAAVILYGVPEDSLYDSLFGSRAFEPAVPRFGATDRRGHSTHLFRFASPSAADLFREISSLAEGLGPASVEIVC